MRLQTPASVCGFYIVAQVTDKVTASNVVSLLPLKLLREFLKGNCEFCKKDATYFDSRCKSLLMQLEFRVLLYRVSNTETWNITLHL